VAQHLLGHLEVSDHAVPERPNRPNVSRRAPDHPSRPITDRLHLSAPLINRDHRRLEQNNPSPALEDNRVGSAKIDR
jgi:hypothetical protein